MLAAGSDKLVADSAGNSGTMALGDSVDADQYVATAAGTGTGQILLSMLTTHTLLQMQSD